MKKLLMPVMIFLSVNAGAMVAPNDEITGVVTSVIDGNTLELTVKNNQTIKLFIAGIDCPEMGQQYGDLAKKLLEKLVLEKEVTVVFQGKDRWGNRLAVVRIGSKDPRVELLKQGLAWTSESNPSPDLDAFRTTAKQRGKGLWKDENPTPPWTYRRQQTMLEAKAS